LLGGSVAPTGAVEPGDPVELVIPPGASGLIVARPDGTSVDFVPGSSGGAAVTFAGTDQPGLYTVTPIVDPAASTAPVASAAASALPTAVATGSGGPSGSPRVSPGASSLPDDPLAPVQFAVALFDVDESSIAPGSAAAIEALGTTTSPASGAGTAPTERPTTHDELWVPIVLLALLALSVEWALYHRDGLVRIRRGLATRLGRRAGGPA